jgi:hypothetical protein
MNKAPEKAEVIKASDQLQKKVGTGTLDAARVERAQGVIDNNKADFAPLARFYLQQLDEAVGQLRRKGDKGSTEPLIAPVMNIKANASTFGYPAVGEMAATVLHFLEHIPQADSDILRILESFSAAVGAMVSHKMTGRDNPAANALLAEFRAVCERYVNKYGTAEAPAESPE